MSVDAAAIAHYTHVVQQLMASVWGNTQVQDEADWQAWVNFPHHDLGTHVDLELVGNARDSLQARALVVVLAPDPSLRIFRDTDSVHSRHTDLLMYVRLELEVEHKKLSPTLLQFLGELLCLTSVTETAQSRESAHLYAEIFIRVLRRLKDNASLRERLVECYPLKGQQTPADRKNLYATFMRSGVSARLKELMEARMRRLTKLPHEYPYDQDYRELVLRSVFPDPESGETFVMTPLLHQQLEFVVEHLADDIRTLEVYETLRFLEVLTEDDDDGLRRKLGYQLLHPRNRGYLMQQLRQGGNVIDTCRRLIREFPGDPKLQEMTAVLALAQEQRMEAASEAQLRRREDDAKRQERQKLWERMR